MRARKGDAKREGIPSFLLHYILITHTHTHTHTVGTTPTQHTGIEETSNEEISYWPAVKGIGAVLVISLIIWFICMFVYSMPIGMSLVDTWLHIKIPCL